MGRLRSTFVLQHPAAGPTSTSLPTWAAGVRPEWELWGDWHASTARTTGFRPLKSPSRPPGADDVRLRAVYDAAMPVYERLRAHAR